MAKEKKEEVVDNTTSKGDDKIIQSLKKNFKTQFGEDLESLNQSTLATIPGYITTGNYALNWIISKDMFKGLPLGRVILFVGNSSSGKSAMALSLMREKSLDYIIYLDSEGGGISQDFAKFMGLDLSKINYTVIETVEDMIKKFALIVDTIEKNKTKKNVLIIVDSVSMLSTDRELDPKGGSDMGYKAKMLRQFFRSYIRKMQKLNICAVFTAHYTKNIGGYGNPNVVSGGTILEYAPSVTIELAKVNSETEIEKNAKGASLVKLRANVIKSRLGTFGKRVMFDLDMNKGLDPYAGIFSILKDYEIIIPAKSDIEEQIKNKEIPQRSTGWWIVVPWEENAKQLYDYIKKNCVESGKFREKQFSQFIEKDEKLLKLINNILQNY